MSINDNQKHLLLLLVTSLLAMLLVFLNSCTKEEPQQTTECSCYELHEVKGYDAQQAQVIWMYDYSTTPQADLCSKDNGQWIYSGNATQFRYKTICK